ncbi:tryptophan--tRNA ligase [Fastidiosibacter lacustris]|uniref:tryptophan--tRNA ligase n=1 Tax=Fastidiosibacter lacustris TaxID=2056695 RepID=UPI000E356573|nr:tryptophan--tRNA ligase [Fastidiosibacter lacustris]
MQQNIKQADRKIVLTGITPSGTPHMGNYIGAIKPALEMAKNPDFNAYFFIADYHSLIKLWDKKLREQYIYQIAATWLALGLDPEKVMFYRQSDIPEIMELNWILTSVTAKGLLNRAHAYKAAVDRNIADGEKDNDAGITMGLFNYPMLMAADIIMFNADLVPVGKDQIQHIEIARDIANRFNHIYKCNLLKAPEAMFDESTQTIPGLDGRKMSKSYNNTIPLFATTKQLRKLVMKVITNSQLPEEPKSTENCTIFSLYRHFATEAEIVVLAKRYHEGISWGEAKQLLFEKMDEVLTPMREKYEYLLANKKIIDEHLKLGAQKARLQAKALLNKLKQQSGL